MDMQEHHPQASGKRGRKELSYRGHNIIVDDPGQQAMPMLSIDNKDVMVRREETGGYSAPMLNMFATYPTLEALARSLIDISPVFLAET